MASDLFNVTVFSQEGLDNEEHSLVMQNKGGAEQTWFDIDYITITVGNGDPKCVLNCGYKSNSHY